MTPELFTLFIIFDWVYIRALAKLTDKIPDHLEYRISRGLRLGIGHKMMVLPWLNARIIGFIVCMLYHREFTFKKIINLN